MFSNISKEIGNKIIECQRNSKFSNASTFNIIPYEKRLRRCQEARARILNNVGCDGMRVVSRKIVKAR